MAILALALACLAGACGYVSAETGRLSALVACLVLWSVAVTVWLVVLS